MVAYATRPGNLSGCWASWTETSVSQVIRTQMDTGVPKVRRRTTGLHRQAQVSVVLPAGLYAAFRNWFDVLCKAGIRPTNIVEPDGTEAIWRFMEPPTIRWVGTSAEAFEVSCELERLPGWQVI